MKITDQLYGEFEVNEPVLVELIKSPSVQRLKRISQIGVPREFRDGRGLSPDFSRCDHSIGVMLLLRRFGASLEEQTAGLLHDVSHTAFSHLYDWVAYDHDQPHPPEDMQDRRHEQFIVNSELPRILEKHRLDVAEVSDHTSYGLLDRERPDICADRIDYFLRQQDQEFVDKILGGLAVRGGMFVFTDPDTAHEFADRFLHYQEDDWGGWEMMVLYLYFSQILRWAIEASVISLEDFERHDDYILTKLKRSDEDLIQRGMGLLRQYNLPQPDGEGKAIYEKFRYVDPYIKSVDGLTRVSKLYPGFAKYLDQASRRNAKGRKIRDLVYHL